MAWTYDDGNVFARILRGEIPCEPVLETEHSLAFPDLRPQAPVHVLVIPRGPTSPGTTSRPRRARPRSPTTPARSDGSARPRGWGRAATA